MKKTKKNIRDKDKIRTGEAHGSAAPRMEPQNKRAEVRSKRDNKQIRKPRKKA